MDLRQLESFVAVVEEGGFTRAAVRVHLTQSGVSAQVLRHERERVAEHLAEHASEVRVADQDEIPGTGRAVQCGLEQVAAGEGTVLVTYGDVPLLDPATLRELLEDLGFDVAELRPALRRTTILGRARRP